MNFYAASTHAFYATDVHGDTMPADAVHVPDEDYAALFAAQSTGKEIQPGPGGYPVSVDPMSLLSLAELKANKLAELAGACSQRMGAIKAGYPADEVQSWGKQESEARAYTASVTAPTPLLSALSTARGVALADLAGRVIAKADQFAAISGGIIGKRQKYEDQVTAAVTAAAVALVVWAP